MSLNKEYVESGDDIDQLEVKLRHLGGDLNRTLVDLGVNGALSLANVQYFEERIVEGAAAALYHVRIDREQLYPEPTDEDLDQIDPGGIVRAAADKLRRVAEDGAMRQNWRAKRCIGSTSNTSDSNRGRDEAALARRQSVQEIHGAHPSRRDRRRAKSDRGAERTRQVNAAGRSAGSLVRTL